MHYKSTSYYYYYYYYYNFFFIIIIIIIIIQSTTDLYLLLGKMTYTDKINASTFMEICDKHPDLD